MTKKEKSKPKSFFKHYKNYVLKKGHSPKSIQKLLSFADKDYADFKLHFDSLETLEFQLLLRYFKRTEKALKADEQHGDFSRKDMHLTMLYVLISELEDDKLFLQILFEDQKKTAALMTKLGLALNQKDWMIFSTNGALTDALKKVHLNPKKNVFVGHTLSVFGFYLNDNSTHYQDTDAYIEKSTDLLFRLSDTSTLMSMFDLGKFLYQRKTSMFNWM